MYIQQGDCKTDLLVNQSKLWSRVWLPPSQNYPIKCSKQSILENIWRFESDLIICIFQYDGWPSGMEMPPTSMYGDHRAALDTLAAHHAAAQQHMNHSSRHNILHSPPHNWEHSSCWENSFQKSSYAQTVKVQFLIKF